MSVGWVSIAWELLVWRAGSSNNYIRIYASWTAAESDDPHYEVMANRALVIWTYGGAYMYFKNYSNSSNSQYRIGINKKDPKATLDIKWSLRIDSSGSPCIMDTCSDTNRWTIVYKGGNFYGCTSDWWQKFSMTDGEPWLSASCQISSAVNEPVVLSY